MKSLKWILVLWASILSFLSAAKSIDQPDVVSTPESGDLITRINNARQIIKRKAENSDLDGLTSSILYEEEAYKWGDWVNWGKWNDWNNWAKWSKWDNWVNWGNRWGNV